MTEILMTNVKSPYGKYVDFKIVPGFERVAEVDRRDGKYVVFGGKGVFTEVARHSKKDMAIEFAKEYIRGFIPDAVFKWNVMQEKIKFV